MERRENTEKFLHTGYFSASFLICSQICGLTVRKSIGTDLSFANQIFQCSYSFFHRKAATDIMYDNRIQIIGSHSAQRVFHVLFHCWSAGVIVNGITVSFVMEITTLISPVQRAFGLQNKIISSAFQCLTKQFLTYSCAIHRCGIDVIYTIFMTNIKQALRVLNCRISVCPDTSAAKPPST